ncbi:hypothetical protein BCV70DRAFT_201332 [Testicularia cyperi]|uniref:Uncharacterized protein n=1 Tax=Testicularia cyperi TaxID=1882483 RepID=A0A317XMT2_9BASI|nr:hypothetical protein BCV70DRAFT_201332 [Testicularia cyperi]
MAKKSARALAAASTSSSYFNDDVSASQVRATSSSSRSTAPLSELSPKSCLTCGRVITPRAKWAKDWNGIKYCSDRCRSSRPGRVVATLQASLLPATLEEQLPDGCLTRSGTDSLVKIDIELLVEAVILRNANESGKAGKPLEDIEAEVRSLLSHDGDIEPRPDGSKPSDESENDDDALKQQRNSMEERSRSSSSNEPAPSDRNPLWKALDSPPGFRERVRRAARRLALGITHESDPWQTTKVTTEQGTIQVLQLGKVISTVEGLSHAKGTIHVRSKSD